jgi:hypothetical protein
MDFDGKELRIAVVSDGSAFGATGAAQDLIIEDFATAPGSGVRAGICQADLRVGICQADRLGSAFRS